jgi:site-specific DNA-methyltransferase (cytosine-N4-specific)
MQDEMTGEIWCGDAFDLAEKLEPASVDLILTSPPYWGLRTYGEEHNNDILHEWRALGESDAMAPPYDWYRQQGGLLGMEPLPEWYVAHLQEILTRLRPAMKDSASLWVNIGDTYFARWSSIRLDGRQGLGDNPRLRRKTPMGGYRQEKQLLLIPARFAITMQEQRWILLNDLIWHKPNVPPRPERDRLRLAHEHFFHFVLRPKEGRAKYHYDLGAVEEGARDVVTVPVRSGSDGHSATFPLELIRPRLESSSPEGGLVLDPFAGTGRTLTAAMALGRHGLGFEVSASFAAAASENVRVARSQLRLL